IDFVMAQPLDNDTINKALESLNGWSYADDKLQKEYEFENFRQAIAFITRISFEAEEQVHHPQIFNVYSTLRVALNTHDAGDKVTEKDVKLAKTIETLYNKFDS